MAKKKYYTIAQIDEIVKTNDWSMCIANNEKNGKPFFGVDTLLIALEEDGDYFGEFVGEPSEDKYTFQFYTS
jgi:hypothetical protein